MARRGDFSKPKMNARERYQARVNYNQQVAQLEGLYRQGATVEDVRAIRESWSTNTPYTVSDGDTLSTIANANGTTETDILKANPDMNALKTGMVINAPSYTMGEKNYTPGASNLPPPALPGSETWRVQQANKPGGLPSNAAIGASMGGLSTYREGEKQYTPGVTPAAAPSFLRPGSPLASANNFLRNFLGTQNYNPNAYATPAERLANPAAQVPGATSPLSPTAPQQAGKPLFNRPYSMTKDDSYPEELWYMIDKTDYVPTQAQMMYLKSQGYAVPNVTASGGGGGGSGGYSSRGRGGGGGGRNNKAPKTPMGGQDYANTERTPAFGNGSGFHGLVNWRI